MLSDESLRVVTRRDWRWADPFSGQSGPFGRSISSAGRTEPRRAVVWLVCALLGAVEGDVPDDPDGIGLDVRLENAGRFGEYRRSGGEIPSVIDASGRRRSIGPGFLDRWRMPRAVYGAERTRRR
jgi:hypothetical protein